MSINVIAKIIAPAMDIISVMPSR